MQTYVLRDEDIGDRNLAYFFYYPSKKEWYIELEDDVTEWDLPMILDHFAKRGERSIPSYWSRRFVENRIVPSDRQNLGSILKNNKLSEYDEFALFVLAEGRCAQDFCHIKKCNPNEIPANIVERRNKRIDFAWMLSEKSMLVFMSGGDSYLVDMQIFGANNGFYERISKYLAQLKLLDTDIDGSRIKLGQSFSMSKEEIVKNGSRLPLSFDDLKEIIERETISTSEAMELLNCSRQNIDDLVKRKKLAPLDIRANSKLFLRSDVLRLMTNS